MRGETEVPYPDSHIGQPQDVCLLHHVPPGSGDEPATVVVATDAEEDAVGEPEPVVSTGGPPNIPHSLEGRDDCLMCHASGSKQVPESHAGRTIDMCRGCHSPN